MFYLKKDRALDYLSTCIDQVHTFGDILQLVIVELIYKVSLVLELSFKAHNPIRFHREALFISPLGLPR